MLKGIGIYEINIFLKASPCLLWELGNCFIKKMALWSCECLLWIQNCYFTGEKQILNVGIQYFDVYNANKLLSSKMKVLIKMI